MAGEEKKTSTTKEVQGITLDEWDAANDALDVLEFINMSLADTNAMGNERANSGLDFCFVNALNNLRGLLNKAYELNSAQTLAGE